MKSFPRWIYALGFSLSVILGFPNSVKASETPKEYPIRFAVIGDRTGSHTPGILGQIVTEIERLKPDFVVTVGDMIEGYRDDTSLINREWEEYKSIMEPLTMPVYFTPGNHDIWSDLSLELYKRQMGEPYYSFDYGASHFIVLDNSRWESSKELPKEQLDWLVSDLGRNQNASYTFVFLHKPFWFQTLAENKPDTLHSIFRNFGVDAVLSGHFHIYFSEEYDGIRYTGVGSSGGAAEPGPTGLKYHFTWITVSERGISIAPIKMGAVLPWDELTAANLKFIGRIDLGALQFEKPLSVSEVLTLEDTEVVVRLENLSSSLILEDTLHWEIPEGWSLEPEKAPLRISAGGSSLIKFRIAKEGELYPVPTIYVRFPYARGKTYLLKKPLAISRKAYCHPADTPPVIDGEISEPIWKDPVSLLFAPDGGPMTIDSVYFYFAYDERNIYISAYCRESKMDSLEATVKERDGTVYGEDCVGYFFQPDRKKGVVYQIYLNPLGAIFDQKITLSPEGRIDGDPSWNGTYEVKTMKGSDYWSIEARIPLDQFQVSIKPGTTWGLNFRRKQKRFNSAADWQVPITYDPSTYGILLMK